MICYTIYAATLVLQYATLPVALRSLVSSDFLVFGMVSQILTILHITALRYSSVIRSQYARRFPLSPIPQTSFLSSVDSYPQGSPGSSFADLCLHTFCLLSIILYLTRTRGRPRPEVSVICLTLVGSLLVVVPIFIFGYYQRHMFLIDYVYYWYAVATICKWFQLCPQLAHNFMRRRAGPTTRFSVIQVAGLCALLVSIYSEGDWMLKPNSTVFGSWFYMVWVSGLLFQFYIYRNNGKSSESKV